MYMGKMSSEFIYWKQYKIKEEVICYHIPTHINSYKYAIITHHKLHTNKYVYIFC